MDLNIKEITAITGDSIVIADEPLFSHTTFRVGGAADLFVEPDSEKTTVELIRYLIKNKIPYMVIGNGSNILVSDKGYRGVIIALGKSFSLVDVAEDGVISAEGGALLSTIAKRASENSLTGFEFAAGIPGSIGGATAMNAGAYGGEIENVILEATILEADGTIKICQPGQLEFGYRTSNIIGKKRTVLSVRLRLIRGDRSEIENKMIDFAQKRRERQPLELPSAGSTFKRPEGYFAGKLIEDAGLCGYRVGGAEISKKHCGFVVNAEGATASDIYILTENVKRIIKDRFGVELEREVKLLGEFK